LINKLLLAHVSYDQAIRVLLTPIADPYALNIMVEDPLNDLWSTGTVAESLKDVLGATYGSLIITICEIAEILDTITRYLNIHGSQKVCCFLFPFLGFLHPSLTKIKLSFTGNQQTQKHSCGESSDCKD
jgi:hypothetical protein